MHIEFVEDERDEICCEKCEDAICTIEDFINEYIDVNEEGTFTLEYFADMLFDLRKDSFEAGKLQAFEQIGNISMNLAYPVDKCDCEENQDKCCEDCCNCDL